MVLDRNLGARWARRWLAAGTIASVALATGGIAVASAAPTPSTAKETALAMAHDPSLVVGAGWVTKASDEAGGVSKDKLGQFPRSGNSYGVLTTGELSEIAEVGRRASTNLYGETPKSRGNTARDVTVLKINLNVPASANCLTFDFKFLSEEHPNYVGDKYNDAFIAELNKTTWTTKGSEITAPDNFAFDSKGQVVSVNAIGLGGMTGAQGAGTAFTPSDNDAYGAATTLLRAAKQVKAGANTLYLSIFDQGDANLDSAVFVDNLQAGWVADPAKNCVSGAQVVSHTLTLTPEKGSADVGGNHTVTATVTDSKGKPAKGIVEFTVTGANPVSNPAPVDSASGQISFNYTGANPGQDVITGCFKTSEKVKGCNASDAVQFTWVGKGPKPTVKPTPKPTPAPTTTPTAKPTPKPTKAPVKKPVKKIVHSG